MVHLRHRLVVDPAPVQTIILTVLRQQINLHRKVAVVVNPEQVKLKQPVIATAKQDLV